MKKFDVEITETLQRTVTVEAASQEEAERMVDHGWHNGDYGLSGCDPEAAANHHPAHGRTHCCLTSLYSLTA